MMNDCMTTLLYYLLYSYFCIIVDMGIVKFPLCLRLWLYLKDNTCIVIVPNECFQNSKLILEMMLTDLPCKIFGSPKLAIDLQ